jgi:hypothetical protein
MIVELVGKSLHWENYFGRGGEGVNYYGKNKNALIKNNKILVLRDSYVSSSFFKENKFILRISLFHIVNSSFVNNIVLANFSHMWVEGGEISNNLFTQNTTHTFVSLSGREFTVNNNVFINASIQISGFKIFSSNNTILSYPPTLLYINNSTFTRNTITNLLPSIRGCGVIVHGKNSTLSKNIIKDFTIGIRLGLKYA